ncbi:MAG: hypothetical protein HYS34_04290, partial [Acidobacteria bacterium]|nr:hypothetical protein [Acidobacteriota bacterium]
MGRIGVGRDRHGKGLRLLAALLTAAAAIGAASAQTDSPCPFSLPMFHGLDSYFQCADALPVAALAYQITAPDSVTSGTLDIICDTVGSID